MARVSKCDKLPENERLRLVGMIGEGTSWPQLAKAFSIPQSSIAEWATRNGYGRSPVEAKRKAVDAILARPETVSETGSKPETGNPDTDAAAERDAKVARLAAGVAVGIIRRLHSLAQGTPDAKETTSIATALDKAWGTYARINKLDDAKPESTNDHSSMAEAVRRKLGI